MPITDDTMKELEDLALEGIRAQFAENRNDLKAACEQTLYSAKDSGKPKFPISIRVVISPNGRNRKVKVVMGWGVKNQTCMEQETGDITPNMF